MLKIKAKTERGIEVIGQHPNNFTAPLPPPDLSQGSARTIIVGDLHGNALKLLDLIKASKILEVSDHDYYKFFHFYLQFYTYNENPAYPKNLILWLKDEARYSISSFRKLANYPITLVLIGDVLCDRGKSDFLTLYLINKIIEAGINVEIILGNHELLFFRLFRYSDILEDRDKQTLRFRFSHISRQERIEYAMSYSDFFGSFEMIPLYEQWIEDDSQYIEWGQEFISKYNAYVDTFINHVNLIKYFELERWRQYLEIPGYYCNVRVDRVYLTHAPYFENAYQDVVRKFNDLSQQFLVPSLDIEPTPSNPAVNIKLLNRNLKKLLHYWIRNADIFPFQSIIEAIDSFVYPSYTFDIPSISNTPFRFLEGILNLPGELNIHGHIGIDFPMYQNGRINLDTNYGRPNDLDMGPWSPTDIPPPPQFQGYTGQLASDLRYPSNQLLFIEANLIDKS